MSWREHRDNSSRTQITGITAVAIRERAPTGIGIQNWIQSWLADRLQLALSQIEPDRPFADLGLDSVTSGALAAELSAWIKLDLPPTLVWDFPTIRLVSNHLARQIDIPVASGNGAEEELSPDAWAEKLSLELASLRQETSV
jgi:acyl carrier protein